MMDEGLTDNDEPLPKLSQCLMCPSRNNLPTLGFTGGDWTTQGSKATNEQW